MLRERLGEPLRVDRAAECVAEHEIAIAVCRARELPLKERLIGPEGMHLENARRDGDEKWHVLLTNPHGTTATPGPWFRKRPEAEAWVEHQPEDARSRAKIIRAG